MFESEPRENQVLVGVENPFGTDKAVAALKSIIPELLRRNWPGGISVADYRQEWAEYSAAFRFDIKLAGIVDLGRVDGEISVYEKDIYITLNLPKRVAEYGDVIKAKIKEELPGLLAKKVEELERGGTGANKSQKKDSSAAQPVKKSFWGKTKKNVGFLARRIKGYTDAEDKEPTARSRGEMHADMQATGDRYFEVLGTLFDRSGNPIKTPIERRLDILKNSPETDIDSTVELERLKNIDPVAGLKNRLAEVSASPEVDPNLSSRITDLEGGPEVDPDLEKGIKDIEDEITDLEAKAVSISKERGEAEEEVKKIKEEIQACEKRQEEIAWEIIDLANTSLPVKLYESTPAGVIKEVENEKMELFGPADRHILESGAEEAQKLLAAMEGVLDELRGPYEDVERKNMRGRKVMERVRNREKSEIERLNERMSKLSRLITNLELHLKESAEDVHPSTERSVQLGHDQPILRGQQELAIQAGMEIDLSENGPTLPEVHADFVWQMKLLSNRLCELRNEGIILDKRSEFIKSKIMPAYQAYDAEVKKIEQLSEEEGGLDKKIAELAEVAEETRRRLDQDSQTLAGLRAERELAIAYRQYELEELKKEADNQQENHSKEIEKLERDIKKAESDYENRLRRLSADIELYKQNRARQINELSAEAEEYRRGLEAELESLKNRRNSLEAEDKSRTEQEKKQKRAKITRRSVSGVVGVVGILATGASVRKGVMGLLDVFEEMGKASEKKAAQIKEVDKPGGLQSPDRYFFDLAEAEVYRNPELEKVAESASRAEKMELVSRYAPNVPGSEFMKFAEHSRVGQVINEAAYRAGEIAKAERMLVLYDGFAAKTMADLDEIIMSLDPKTERLKHARRAKDYFQEQWSPERRRAILTKGKEHRVELEDLERKLPMIAAEEVKKQILESRKDGYWEDATPEEIAAKRAERAAKSKKKSEEE